MIDYEEEEKKTTHQGQSRNYKVDETRGMWSSNLTCDSDKCKIQCYQMFIIISINRGDDNNNNNNNND